MEKRRTTAVVYAWITLPVVLGAVTAILVRLLLLPLAEGAIREGKNVYLHAVKKRDATEFPRREAETAARNDQLDSIIHAIHERSKNRDRSFIDALYSYADTCGFSAGKVEAGIPQPVGNHTETAISIDGSGSYRATGTFVEKIENSPHSTRVRQLIIKENGERHEPEVFIEVVLMEE